MQYVALFLYWLAFCCTMLAFLLLSTCKYRLPEPDLEKLKTDSLFGGFVRRCRLAMTLLLSLIVCMGVWGWGCIFASRLLEGFPSWVEHFFFFWSPLLFTTLVTVTIWFAFIEKRFLLWSYQHLNLQRSH